jgi:osmotically-inducible protein OsmY
MSSDTTSTHSSAEPEAGTGSNWQDIMFDRSARSAPSRSTWRKRSQARTATLVILVVLIVALGVFASARGGAPIIGSAQSVLRTVGGTSQDAAMAAKVKMALALSKYVSAFDIHVAARAGNITLTGQVPTPEARAMAETIARDTAGVKQVLNYVTLDARAQPGELERGTVFVSGTVDTSDLRDRVGQAVSTVDGVARVVNNLAVRAATTPVDPGERVLERRVEFNLWTSRAFDLSHIQVQVANRTVTLNGSVRSTAEKLLAERLAIESAGVQEVVNNLATPPDVSSTNPADVPQSP